MSGAATVPPLVARLEAFGRDDVPVAGGKGANLGELVRAGFPVPSGLVVTTRAYELVAAQDTVAASVAALAGINLADPIAVATASRALRKAFAAATIPRETADALRAALQRLGPVAVAVHSSATAEDLPGATFAGQQDTYLNVVGEDAVLDAVRRCWGSLWSERAIAYRQQRGIEHAAVRLAVVVQELVVADIAGVLFTANPLTGARDELVIDANPGLGEAVVSGVVTPDHYIVKKGSHAVVAQQVGRREVVIRPAAGGGAESVSPAGSSLGPALAARDLSALAGRGEAVERHFGSPQDVEWALVAGRLFVLQSRPITALPPEPSYRSAGA